MVKNYQRLEEELARGLSIEDPAIRAEHAAIKAKVDAGHSLKAAILRRVTEVLDELYAQMPQIR